MYEKYGVLYNLSGHMHIQHIVQSANGFLEIAGSLLAVSLKQYDILTLNRTQAECRTKAVDVSGWAKNQNLTDKTLLNFKQYSHKFFAETTEQKVNIKLADSVNASQLANFFVKVNTTYFADRMDAIDWERALYNPMAETDIVYCILSEKHRRRYFSKPDFTFIQLGIAIQSAIGNRRMQLCPPVPDHLIINSAEKSVLMNYALFWFVFLIPTNDWQVWIDPFCH